MPPKQNKKVEEKKKQKIVEDKTFGLKNKKGAKMQKYIQNVEKNIMGNKGKPGQTSKKKGEEDDDLNDFSKIFKPVQAMPKISADVDPKSVLCQFFKQGLCTKGDKCKFSHDLATQQKTAKRNLYVDSRQLKDENTETNEDWDEEKLKDVVGKKHEEKDKKRPNQTDIVCKFFIEAIEISKYGWFWECPNGDTCIYRHALPKDYILKKDRKKMEEQDRLDHISLEELIEKERGTLANRATTKVTLETFLAWKKRKLREKHNKKIAADRKKMTTFKAGKQQGLSGRDLFTFNPDFVANDNMETDGDIAQCDRSADDDNEEDAKTFDINENTFCTVDAEGKRLVDYDDNDNRLYDDEGNEMADIEGPNNSDQVDFDRELFDDVEDLPDSEDENEAGTSSQIRPKSSAESSDVEDLCHETNQRLIT